MKKYQESLRFRRCRGQITSTRLVSLGDPIRRLYPINSRFCGHEVPDLILMKILQALIWGCSGSSNTKTKFSRVASSVLVVSEVSKARCKSMGTTNYQGHFDLERYLNSLRYRRELAVVHIDKVEDVWSQAWQYQSETRISKDVQL